MKILINTDGDKHALRCQNTPKTSEFDIVFHGGSDELSTEVWFEIVP
jgi:hypothetical protein